MDDVLRRALIAGARAFADELERGAGGAEGAVVPGTIGSMLEVLACIGRINDDLGRGADDEEMRDIARRAGMDPRGIAGYFAANLLEKREDGRWLLPAGRERLERLQALRGVRLFPPRQPGSDGSGK